MGAIRAAFAAASRRAGDDAGDIGWTAEADRAFPPCRAGVFEVALVPAAGTIAHALHYRLGDDWEIGPVAHAGWRRAADVLEGARRRLADRVRAVWVEVEGSPPVAFAYLSLGPTDGPGVALREAVPTLAACFEVLGAEGPPASALTVAPPEARVLHVASLAHRGHDAARLSVLLPVAGLGAWLEALGWPGDLDLLLRVAVTLTGLTEPALVQVDFVGGRVGAAIAIERWRPPGSADWTPIGAALCGFGVAPADWLRIAAWPGACQDAGACDLEVKVRVSGDRVDAVKAYLLFAPPS